MLDAPTHAAPLLLIASGCVFVAAGRLVRLPWLWGPLGLIVVLAAGILLAWLPPAGGALARCVQAGVLGVDLLLILTMWRQERHRGAAGTFALLLLSSAGVMCVAAVDNLVLMFVSLELAWFPLFLMMLPHDPDGATSRRFGWLGILSGLLLLYGLVLLYGTAGTIELPHRDSEGPNAGALGLVALILILAGLGMRLPALPFHLGTAELLDGFRYGVAAALIILPKTAAAVALIRLLPNMPAAHQAAGQLLMLVLSGLTMLAGGVAAATQTRLRGVLQGIAMAFGGLVLGGIAVALWEAAHPGQRLTGGEGLPGGIPAALFSLGSYALLTCGVFGLLAYLTSEERPIEDVDDLVGLIRSEPVPAFCATILLFGLAGLPLLPGFWGRLWTVGAAFATLGESSMGSLQPAPHAGFVALVCAIGLSWLLVAGACLRMIGAILFEGPRAHPRPSGGQAALVAALLATFIAVGIGVLPGPLVDALLPIEPNDAAVESR